ncbi:hypothetical protein E3P86_02288 [Wallemia ichthyophaga]|uniref:Fe2OG dioxygenase domain-containing protein n=1 Tax=Wallemia ichthyophaga TaxID=245174 RepID=A0A4T0J3Y9_WALIC|nr:hypothetical protein E3P86_02288 [Wallemia ichthyophaga]
MPLSKQRFARPPTPPDTDTTLRRSERFYKRKDIPLDLSDAFDWLRDDSSAVKIGDKCYTFENHPGLVYLPNYLNEHDQKRMIKLSLRDIPAPPNRNSLDAHYKIPIEGLWHHYAASTKTDVAVPRAATEPPREMPSYYAPSGERPLINNQPSTFEALKQIAREHNPEIPPSPTVKPLNGERAMYKLRWTNIGHYYHWGLKQYDFSVRDPQTAGPIAIPQPVAQVCKGAVEAIPWQRTCVAEAAEEWKKGYKPDAGIINYYNLNDTLMAHVDRSEVTSSLPLVSISLGHSAVFLIGDDERESKSPPTPIVLRSGDVVVMSGPTRRSYHGVPRILERSLPPHLQNEQEDDEWEPFARYLSTARINVNVRQTGLSDQQIAELVSV